VNKNVYSYISIEMSSTDDIRTKEDFKEVFGRSPIKPGQQLEWDNDELDDEETQITNEIHRQENGAFYNNVATNAKRRLYGELLEKPGIRDNLDKIPLNSLTKRIPKHNGDNMRGGRKRTRIFRKRSTKRRLNKSSRRNSRKYK
jgi:hypothetical protein